MSLNLEVARQNMVVQQVRPWDVIDERVLEVLGRIRREDFVATRYRKLAFADTMLPLDGGEVMMKPVVEGRMLQAVAIKPGESVLEVGTGSGFIAACLAALGGRVSSIERLPALLGKARQRLQQAGFGDIELIEGDVVAFDPTTRFDVVVVTGAVHSRPEQFLRWAKVGGRAFVISGSAPVLKAQMWTRLAVDRQHCESLFETDLPYLFGYAPQPAFEF